jgi:hypothetical protein
MLFYEKCLPSNKEKVPDDEKICEPAKKFNFELSKELEQVILSCFPIKASCCKLFQ